MSATPAWRAARAVHPGAIVVRVLLLDKGVGFFLRLNPTPARRAEAELYDGATVFVPALPEDTPEAERAAIVKTYDALAA